MIITPSPTLANTTALAWLAAFQAGPAAAAIEFYTGSKPAATTVVPNGTTQILLGTCLCSTVPDVGAVVDSRLTFADIAQEAAADADGTATWARVRDGNSTAVLDVDVSDIGGNAFLRLNTTSIRAGGPIAISSFYIDF